MAAQIPAPSSVHIYPIPPQRADETGSSTLSTGPRKIHTQPSPINESLQTPRARRPTHVPGRRNSAPTWPWRAATRRAGRGRRALLAGGQPRRGPAGMPRAGPSSSGDGTPWYCSVDVVGGSVDETERMIQQGVGAASCETVSHGFGRRAPLLRLLVGATRAAAPFEASDAASRRPCPQF